MSDDWNCQWAELFDRYSKPEVSMDCSEHGGGGQLFKIPTPLHTLKSKFGNNQQKFQRKQMEYESKSGGFRSTRPGPIRSVPTQSGTYLHSSFGNSSIYKYETTAAITIRCNSKNNSIRFTSASGNFTIH